jgi:hypothetical protein
VCIDASSSFTTLLSRITEIRSVSNGWMDAQLARSLRVVTTAAAGAWRDFCLLERITWEEKRGERRVTDVCTMNW